MDNEKGEIEKIIADDLQANEYKVPPAPDDKAERLAYAASRRIISALERNGFKIVRK